MDARSIKNVLGQLSRVKKNVVGFLLVNVKKPEANNKYYSKYHAKQAKSHLLEEKEVKYA